MQNIKSRNGRTVEKEEAPGVRSLRQIKRGQVYYELNVLDFTTRWKRREHLEFFRITILNLILVIAYSVHSAT